VGALDISHNVHGLLWFLDRVMPYVVQALPDAELVVAGRRPPRSLADRLGSAPNVTFLGEVPAVDPVIQNSRIAINPAVSGSGINMKCGAPASAGTPVVTTPVGARGLETLFPPDLGPTADPRHMASICLRLLSDDRHWRAQSQAFVAASERFSAATTGNLMLQEIAQELSR
jgi:glycosyltransferase involved in cell wall biosynthesis